MRDTLQVEAPSVDETPESALLPSGLRSRVRGLTRAKGFRAALVAIGAAFVLTACGATIDTEMNVTNSGAGERVMRLTLSETAREDADLDTAAADKSIRSHLPESMTYTGLQEAADGALTTTVTLPFDSTEDYEEKAAQILSEGTVEPDIEFSVSDSILVNGITLRESHTSGQLLMWLFEGLIEDGVVTETDKSDMYELGDGVVNFRGVATKQSGAFNVAEVENNGFDAVTMQTHINGEDDITRTLTYTASKSRYAANQKVLAEFIGESTPKGATVETPSNGTWTMSFAGDSSFIESATTTALGGAQADFSLDMGEAADDPSTLELKASNTASCDAVCYMSTPILDTVTAASGYTPETVEIDTTERAVTTFIYAPPIGSVAAVFDFGMDGSVEANVDFVVPKSSVDAVGDGFARHLDPGKDVGTLTTTSDGPDTTYSVAIRGEDEQDFAAKYTRWASDARVGSYAEDHLFLRDTDFVVSPALNNLTGRHAVTGDATTELVMPFGQWTKKVDPGTTETFALGGVRITGTGLDGTVTVRGTGFTLGGLIAVFFLLAAAVVAGWLLLRHRQTILPKLAAVLARIRTALTDERHLRFEPDNLARPASGNSESLFMLAREESAGNGGTGIAGPSTFDLPVPPRSAAGHLPDRRSVLLMPAHPQTPGRQATLFDLPPDRPTDRRASLLG